MMTFLYGLMWIWVVLGVMMWIDSTFIYSDPPRTILGWIWAITFSLPLLILFGAILWVSYLWSTLKR